MEEKLIIHKDAEPYKVKIIKGQKDTYGWEVTAQGENFDRAMDEAVAVDKKLRNLYHERLGGN